MMKPSKLHHNALFILFLFTIACGSNTPDPEVPTFIIGGSVTGLDGTLVIANKGEEFSITTSGDFEVEGEFPEGTEYDITIEEQPNGQECAIENGSGTVTDENVEDVEITCVSFPTLSYSSLVFEENATFNNGTMDEISITLEHDTFVTMGAWTEGVEYEWSGTPLPAGLTLSAISDADSVSLSFAGTADAHRTVDDVQGVTFTILPAAFTSGEAPEGNSQDFEFQFLNATTIVVYGAGLYNGNLGGRLGADLICETEKPGSVQHANVRAFIGVSGLDEIQDFAILTALDTTLPVRSINTMTVANDWADFVDNDVDVSMQAASVTSNGVSHWSGSFANGSVTPIDTCLGWTSSNNMDTGSTGSSSGTGSFLLDNISQDCDQMRHLLCVAYD